MNFLSGAEIKCPLFVLERVRIMEGFLMKIHGNFVVRLETVRNRGVRIAEVRLYCNSVLVDFFSFFFPLIILRYRPNPIY